MAKNKQLPIKEHVKLLERVPNASDERRKYLHLEKNENLIPFPKKYLAKICAALTSDFISSYPELDSLSGRVAGWVGLSQENIYLTAGSDAAIKTIFEVFVRPGDKIAMLHPTYAMYYVYAGMFQAKLIKLDCRADLAFSVDAIINCLKKEKPRLICLANPNSPTGTVIKPRDLEKIIAYATRASAIVLVDEAYGLYYSKSVIKLVKKYSHLVVTRTFSKALGLAGSRVGFAVAGEEMIKAFRKVRPMYEVNAIGAKFAEILLGYPDIIKRNVILTMANKRFVEKELDKMGVSYFQSSANFILIDVGSYELSSLIVKELKTRGILIGGPFRHPRLNDCIRVTVGTKTQMKLFLRELKGMLRNKLA